MLGEVVAERAAADVIAGAEVIADVVESSAAWVDEEMGAGTTVDDETRAGSTADEVTGAGAGEELVMRVIGVDASTWEEIIGVAETVVFAGADAAKVGCVASG